MVDVPPDARYVAVVKFAALLEPRTEAYARGTTVSSQRPTSALEEAALPYLVPAIDGVTIEPTHTARPNIRATIWHRDPDQAYDLTALLYGLVMAAPLGAFEQPQTIVAPYRDRDPQTRQDIASFTVQVAMPMQAV